MANDEIRRPDDSQFEDISVATLGLTGGAALFFRQGQGRKFNDAILKTRVYLSSFGEVWDRYSEDLSLLSKNDLDRALVRARERYDKVRGGSQYFRPTDTDAIEGLRKYYRISVDQKKTLQQFYNSDIQRVALEAIGQYELPENIKSALISNLHSLAVQDNPQEVFRKLATRLDSDLMKGFSDVFNQVVDSVEKWKQDNDFETTWMDNRGNKLIQEYKNNVFDLDTLLKQQEDAKRTLSGRARRAINPDRNVTIGDILDILENGSEEEQVGIKRFLNRDSAIFFGSGDQAVLTKAQKELLKDREHYFGEKITPKNTQAPTILDLINEHAGELSEEDLNKFKKLEINQLYKSATGEIYTLADTTHALGNVADEVTNIFPFNMTRFQDYRNAQKSRPYSHTFLAGELSPVIASHLGDDDLLGSTVQYINGRYFKVNANGKFEEIKGLRGAFIASAETGILKELNRSMNYGESRADDSERSKWGRKLGIEFDVQNMEKTYGHNADVFVNFDSQNIKELEDIVNVTEQDGYEAIYRKLELGNRADRFSRFVERSSYGFSTEDAQKILDKLPTDSEASKYLQFIVDLKETPEEFEQTMLSLSKLGGSDLTYKNSHLARAIRRYMRDPNVVFESYMSTKKDPMMRKTGQFRSLTFAEEIKEELSKEFLARYGDEKGYVEVDRLLTESLSGQSQRQAKELNVARKYLEILGFPFESKNKAGEHISTLSIDEVVKHLSEFAADNSEESQLIKSQLQEFIARNSLTDIDEFKISAKNQIFYKPSNMMVLNNSVGAQEALDIIKNINEGHLEQAGENMANFGKRFFSQFVAGAGSPQNFTKFSVLPYFLLNRVNEEMHLEFRVPFTKKHVDLDLRVKGEGARSAGSLIKTWGMKRILPVMAAYYAYDFVDDMSKASSGMGVTEAGVSGLANVGLGVKRTTGVLGLDSALKSFTKDNAFFNYVGDNDGEWKTYDEKLEYYRNGYDPIRKARYWWFGSSNEFRGGRISYFEPNTLRMLASDYKDMSLYNGSYWNKWNLLNILNPYYLEDLHAEDRPYPVSGSMFAENTPWGIILNPTVGALLKPKRYLHSDRLSSDGVDVKALIASMNNQIRANAMDNNNLLYVQGGSLRAMNFMAYNAPTFSDRIISLDTGEKTAQVNDYGLYNTPVDLRNELYQELINNNQKFIEQNQKLTLKDLVAIQAAKGNQVAQFTTMLTGSSLNIIKEENKKILAAAGYDRTQGIMLENKFRPDSSSAIDQMLEDSETIADLLQAGSGNDYIHEMAVSARMITGLYGWGISNMLDVGQNNQDRIATSADMTSFSRTFWDSGIGGLDFDLLAGMTGGSGSIMEITRRFIPEYRRFQTKNPLMNTMPDWLPDRFRFGDPYTLVPNGEARLPGYGYESLNRLHPDIYGEHYGAFDRFKILADIAPYSPEYKFWKNVASKTVDDPYLRKEMEDIKARVKAQNKQHDFQEYKYVDRDVDRRRVYITSIGENGTFTVYGSDATYKLAGATVSANENERRSDVLSRYLQPGQLVTLVVDTNEAYARNRDKSSSINAAVLIDGESVAEQMIENGDAKRRQSDLSVAAVQGRHGAVMNGINWITEAVMHADLPILHNRWLRANTALEDYQDEYIYGTSFQSWDDIWGTFILPNMQKSANSTFWTATAIAGDIVRNNLLGDTKHNLLSDLAEKYIKEDGPWGKYRDLSQIVKSKSTANWISRAQYMTDRGALMGYLTGKFSKLGRSDNITLAQTKFRRAGVALNLAFSAVMAPENLAVGMMSWSRLGYMVANEHFGGAKYRAAAAGVGALIGLARWGGTKKALSSDPYKDTYIPDNVKKRWELQDYFDRLTYLKYMALYEKAADLAKSEEDVDIKAILERQKEEAQNIKESKETLGQALKDLENERGANAAEARKLLAMRLKDIQPTKVPLAGGEYAKSAVMYYNAARATMYAMDETSSMADVIRALPKTEREYFMEFVKERDEEKREEILKTVSPMLRKALNKFWYQKIDEPESNESFFQKHALPAPTWAGWNPQVDLADVQAKVIKNEALNYSDFGIYASQYREPDVMNAPDLNYSASDSLIESSLKIKTILSGLGLFGVEVSVEPSGGSTLDVIANVARVVEYKIEDDITHIFDNL